MSIVELGLVYEWTSQTTASSRSNTRSQAPLSAGAVIDGQIQDVLSRPSRVKQVVGKLTFSPLGTRRRWPVTTSRCSSASGSRSSSRHGGEPCRAGLAPPVRDRAATLDHHCPPRRSSPAA